MNSQGYISKFMPQSLLFHPDFTEGTWTMNALSSGIEEIILDSGQIIGSITSQTMGTASITSVIGTYVQKASYTSDINFRTNGQNYLISENSTVRITSEQPCSISGSTSISYSIGDYDRTVPSWISVDSQTGIITIETPIISSETKYNFYLNSAVSGISHSIQKLIGLTVLKWVASNCLKCSNTSGTIWQIWNSSYILSSGVWIFPTSSKTSTQDSELSIDTPKVLKITVISVIFTTALYSSFTISMNPSSIIAVWLAVEQYQMYLLLLITRAFIPEDIKTVVKGLDFWTNIYEYIPYKENGLFFSFFKSFEFDLTNPPLRDLEINYNSTFANMYSFIAWLMLLILFYLIILLLNKLFSKWKENKSCWYRALYKIVSKITAIMTFSVFIRNFLEITQFVMLSSINELHVFDTSSLLRIVSLIYAMLMIFAFLWTFGTTLFLTFSSYKTNEGHHSMLGELINSLQNNTKSKFYAVLILTRKLFFVLVLVILDSIESKKIIFILSCFQVGYTAYVAVVRPYNSIKLNIYEIINEVDYTLHLICLMFFNTKDDWNDISTSIYMWTLAINAMIVFVIVFSKAYSIIFSCVYYPNCSMNYEKVE